jgi:DNA-binding response OmpR family regulator
MERGGVRLLIIEDDSHTARCLVRGLRQSGHAVHHAADGETGLVIPLEGICDALIVDRGLPALDGLILVRRPRATSAAMLVLMLSAIGVVRDRVEGFQAGRADHLAKPYAFGEVLARLEALARRANPDAAGQGIAGCGPGIRHEGAARQPREPADTVVTSQFSVAGVIDAARGCATRGGWLPDRC